MQNSAYQHESAERHDGLTARAYKNCMTYQPKPPEIFPANGMSTSIVSDKGARGNNRIVAVEARKIETASSNRGLSRTLVYLVSVAATCITALVASFLVRHLDLANIAMLFLLTVVLIAVRFGRGPAVASTVVGVAALDFGFVPPRFSFGVADFQYLVTFAVMLGVGILIAHLTAGLRYQAHVAATREARSKDLYEFARELSGVLQTEQIVEITQKYIERTFHANALLLVPDSNGDLKPPPFSKAENPQGLNPGVLDMAVAQWAFDNARPSGFGTDTIGSSAFSFLPLVAPMRARGVLAVRQKPEHRCQVTEQEHQLNTYAALVAIALERLHYIDVAQSAQVRMESERLRNSMLSALSHDLRTPLTSLVGLSESLAMSRPALAPNQVELTDALQDETRRMSKLVENLLEMASIQSGKVGLNLQWQYFEEVVGSALRASRTLLSRHEVRTVLAPDMPLVRFDAVLVERVLCNLFENAAKYTPPGSRITLAAQANDERLVVEVYDNGPGLPPGKEDIIFEKFVRGQHESALPGVGLGLSICRAIIDAHGGSMIAKESVDGGACFTFSFPLEVPPAMPALDEEDIKGFEPLQ